MIKPERDMFLKHFEWDEKHSESIILRYPSGLLECSRKANQFLHRVDTMFQSICKTLSVRPDDRVAIHLCPNHLCSELKIPAPAAIPQAYLLTVLGTGSDFRDYQNQLGHELTHLIAYFWDKCIYHLEILEEGLAVAVGEKHEHHVMYRLSNSIGVLDSNLVDTVFDIDYHRFCTDYGKAGSFSKFLIERYGLERYRMLYVGSQLSCQGLVYFKGEKLLHKDYLRELLQRVYKIESRVLAITWLKTVLESSNGHVQK